MQPIQYDSGILQQYADELNEQATTIVFATTMRYAVIFFMASGLVFLSLLVPPSSNLTPENAERVVIFSICMVIIITLFAILAGMYAGKKKAFALKLQAQQILCQRQIEQNTRQDKVLSSALN